MPLASFALVALRKFTDRLVAFTGSTGHHPLLPVGGRLAERPDLEIDPDTMCRTARHAWLALEIALSTPAVHEHLAGLSPQVRAGIFREQLEVLLDLIQQAGLEGDNDLCRACLEELRSVRQRRVHPGSNGVTSARNGMIEEAEEADEPSLAGIMDDLEQAGYPHLATLGGLRTPWDEPLFPGMLEYFLRRSFPDPATDSSDDSWRCLEVMAHLLEEHQEEVEALLDRPEEIGEPNLDEEPDAEAVAALYQLGLNCSRRGDHRQAVVHFTAAAKLEPTNALVYHQRGQAFRMLCKYQRAIADFQIALRLSPRAPAILVSRAVAYHLAGEHERAIGDCTAALSLDPDQAAAYRTRASAATERGDHLGAVADLTRVIALTPEDDEALYLRGVAYARLRDYSAAIADFNGAIERNPEHVPAWLHRAHSHRRLQDFDQAIRDYSELIRHHPGNALAYSGRGLTWKLQGQVNRAIADLTEALRLEPGEARDYYHRGTLYRARGDFVRAHADLDEAIRLEPELWQALYCRAKILFAEGRYSLAILDLTEVLRLNPGLVAGYLSRALSYDRVGNHRDALVDSTHGIELEAESPSAWLVRGVVHAHQGNREAAIADLTEAIRLDDRFALAYHERGMAFTLQGDYDRALADCNQLIALEPTNAQGYATRSIVYHFKGEVAGALTDYSRALQIDPKRMMTWWNEPLADSTRSQAAQRIADSIDGLRHEAPAPSPTPEHAPAPDPALSDFQIVIKPTTLEAATAAVRQKRAAPRKKPVRQEALQPLHLATDSIVPATPEPVKETPAAEFIPEEPATPPPSLETIAQAPEPKPAPKAPVSEQREELAADILSMVEEPEDAEETLEPEQKRRPDGPSGRSPKGKIEWDQPVLPSAVAPVAVTCRNCNRETIPLPVSEGRGRCEHCKSVFPLGMAPRPPVRQVEDGESFLETWRKPLLVLAGMAALLLVFVGFREKLFGNGRVRVYRAQGTAEYDGKPMASATIFLHPVDAKKAFFPRPCATVREDGTFILGTYGKGDGAPAGEYKITVQWVTQTQGKDVPVNVLPEKYAVAHTSDLIVRIKAGDNLLPPIQFTKTGEKVASIQ
jgi:tetratricopeptide (TPR) repeat protein